MSGLVVIIPLLLLWLIFMFQVLKYILSPPEKKFAKIFAKFDDGYSPEELVKLTFDSDDGAGLFLKLYSLIPFIGIIGSVGKNLVPSEKLKKYKRIHKKYLKYRR